MTEKRGQKCFLKTCLTMQNHCAMIKMMVFHCGCAIKTRQRRVDSEIENREENL
jgi:hypothetical protein